MRFPAQKISVDGGRGCLRKLRDLLALERTGETRALLNSDEGLGKMTVFAMHGVVRGAVRTSMVHRNMIDEEAFIQHLRGRAPYVPIEKAVRGEGDALTIDDATEAAARAAELAREEGSEVVLFVNSHNISQGNPYFFSLLNTALDAACDQSFSFRGQMYDLSSPENKLYARAKIKREILGEISEERRLATAAAAARCMCPGKSANIPEYLSTISVDRLKQLVRVGVTIGNHGRTHCQFAYLDERTCIEEIDAGARWIRAVTGIYPEYFAVPFGEFVPPWKRSKLYALYMLATNALHEGAVGPQIVNRATLRPSADAQ